MSLLQQVHKIDLSANQKFKVVPIYTVPVDIVYYYCSTPTYYYNYNNILTTYYYNCYLPTSSYNYYNYY